MQAWPDNGDEHSHSLWHSEQVHCVFGAVSCCHWSVLWMGFIVCLGWWQKGFCLGLCLLVILTLNTCIQELHVSFVHWAVLAALLCAEARHWQLSFIIFNCLPYTLYIRKLLVPRTHNKLVNRSFSAAGPWLWNDLPPGLRRPGLSFDSFRWFLKTHLFGNWST